MLGLIKLGLWDFKITSFSHIMPLQSAGGGKKNHPNQSITPLVHPLMPPSGLWLPNVFSLINRTNSSCAKPLFTVHQFFLSFSSLTYPPSTFSPKTDTGTNKITINECNLLSDMRLRCFSGWHFQVTTTIRYCIKGEPSMSLPAPVRCVA